ncbi:TetR/AcrR family transcriptional regulator [Parahaliea mediterranea]|uniref:TetR/AcrR family transcriptional regulator n=1 Tax=Parahaliea mediterranea TaxID=651086 RepID=UPI000E2FE389|nr:TetR/AcrR family transcriptional regulator [Parahaliea mediterranea]
MSRAKGNAREDILDTAERLFAARGTQNVSLREINAEAGYSAAALHYHFRSREALLETLLEVRRQPIMELRSTLLQPLQDQEQPSLESLVNALVMPLAKAIISDPTPGLITVKFFYRAYIELNHLGHIRKITEHSFKKFEPLLAKALPEAQEEVLRFRWLLATELTFQGLANMDTILSINGQPDTRKKREQYVHDLTSFIVGGLKHSG